MSVSGRYTRYSFKEHALSDDERRWLTLASLPGFRVRSAKVQFTNEGLRDFDPDKIDRRLYADGQLSLIGLWHVDPQAEIFSVADRVARVMKNIVLESPDVNAVTVEEIAEKAELDPEQVGDALYQMSRHARLYSSASLNQNRITRIHLETDSAIDVYLQYTTLDDLLEDNYVARGRPANEFLPAGRGEEDRELEQKFRILYSQPQQQRDFERLRIEAEDDDFSVSVLFIDIDHFKKLNSRHTETAVDRTILPQAQHLLRRLVSHRGTAYRHGGEEFSVLLPNQAADEAAAFAEKVRRTFEGYEFQTEQGAEKLTVSIGVATFPNDGQTFDAVLSAANAAEHTAKKAGRNTVRAASGRTDRPLPSNSVSAAADVPRTHLAFVAVPNHLWWHMGRRGDTPSMQISMDWYVTNVSDVPVRILSARLLDPNPTDHTCHVIVSTRTHHENGPSPRGHFGIDAVISPHETAEVGVQFYFDPPVKDAGSPLSVEFILCDQYGREHGAPPITLQHR